MVDFNVVSDGDLKKVEYCKIEPGIGIARLGNSKVEHFIGPESVDDTGPPPMGYKDAQGRVKRQAARFRIFAYDKAGRPLGEVTSNHAEINWTVCLANKKASYFKFFSRLSGREPSTEERRNTNVRNPHIHWDDKNSTDDFKAAEALLNERVELIIRPESKSICGQKVSGAGYQFNDGEFLKKKVPLGELRTDPNGRLLVLGGCGTSAAVNQKDPALPVDEPLTDYANNDNWHDDVSDGPVTATVRLKGRSKPMEAENGAWVIVAPPNFAPGINSIVTLYDVMRDAAIRKGYLKAPDTVVYDRDIRPLLQRMLDQSWVNIDAMRGHGYAKRGAYDLCSDKFKCNYENAEPREKKAWKRLRKSILKRIRIPHELLDQRIKEAENDANSATGKKQKKAEKSHKRLTPLKQQQASLAFMPPISGDDGTAVHGEPDKWLSILPSQYEMLEDWVKGRFETGDRDGGADTGNLAHQIAQLQRAALEPCVGGAFYPGIEITYICEARKCDHADDLYCEAFRIRHDDQRRSAGDLTKHMAVPWQADFYKCAGNWWPAQRPDDVVPQHVYDAIRDTLVEGDDAPIIEGLDARVPWDRGLGTTSVYRRPWRNPVLGVPDDPSRPGTGDDDPRNPVGLGHRDMVDYWHELGFVHRVTLSETEQGEGSRKYAGTVHVERERRPFAGMDIRKLFHALQNLDTNRDCLAKAQEYVENVLQAARDLQKAPGTFEFLDHLRSFEYTDCAFVARMKDIYDDAADLADPRGPFPYHPASDVLRTREDVIERIKQLTPFNFVDGGWLRNIHRMGTADHVNMLLFEILSEELGEGDVAKNHANIYRTLCQSVGFYPPPADSRAFAYSEEFLDSAFENPVFQLAASEFPQTYYPEIIGMTLYLEWSVQTLRRPARLLEHHGMDPYFYTLHIAIDNADHGHGSKIIEAIMIYLSKVRRDEGDAAVQKTWSRIWDGYVAFGYTLVNLVEQIKYIVRNPPSLYSRLRAMIESKREFGQLNHGDKTLSGRPLNSLFRYPHEFLVALEQEGFIVPGDPRSSTLLELFGSRGPMYQVFSEEEIDLWRQWIEWRDPCEKISDQLQGAFFTSTEIRGHLDWLEQRKPFRDKQKTARDQAAEFIRELVGYAAPWRVQCWLVGARPHLENKKNNDVCAKDHLRSTYAEPWTGCCMVRVLNDLALRQMDSPGHDGVTLDEADGNSVELRDLFNAIASSGRNIEPERRLLRALVLSGYVVPKDTTQGRLIEDYLNATRPMGRAFQAVIPGNDGHTAHRTLLNWIRLGCKIPEPHECKLRACGLDVTEDEEMHHMTGLAFGMGCLH